MDLPISTIPIQQSKGYVMRMHESRVSIADGSSELRLSGTLSEWLFSSNFWSNFNAKNGTTFDQFEEDEVDVSIVSEVIEALEVRIHELQRNGNCNIEFVYRWTAEKQPLTIKVLAETLILELESFRGFLGAALNKNIGVIFSL
ncbi:hypothetical protein [Burkholderia sp. USMB20]|uniref:hypothetical protein n=1 Tax=Burkholderia sp. USMB20 TaxID=1571773 RepID=UPI00109191B1|nr:hypothetical protein [Burkholderia sp. USMB20]TGN95789.1 hypothetical protein PL79_022235 [Burkholderia sp. USMB20]